MKKWLKSLSKEQIQRYVFVGLLVLVFVAFFVSVGVANNTEKPSDNIDNTDDGKNDNSNNQNNNDNQNNQQVPNTPEPKKEVINLPLSDDFVVVRKYYEPEDSSEEQELAVIQFGKRYYTSNGVALSRKDEQDFQVLAALSGEVVSIDENPIYGIIVTIKHENELYTEYSSLSEATVQTGAQVKQGDVIGVSGVCEYDSTLKSHVYFKVMTGSKTFNPENVIGKTIEETLK
jgi:stage II sporulation protein Q